MTQEVYDMFAKFEADRRIITSTVRVREEGELPPHLVRMDKGIVPTYIKSTPYQMFAWRMFGNMIKKNYRPQQKLDEDLLKAQMKIRPEEYMAVVWMSTIIALIIGIVLCILLSLLIPFPAGVIAGVVAVVILPLMTYFMMLYWYPSSKAKARARSIEAKIPSAMAFISAMASADVNVDVIFKELARQQVYGEIRNEASWITRDTELLGVDILSAIRKGAQRTPSPKFQDFLQGVVTTSTSGGQLKPYFLIKAEQFEKEAKLDLKRKIETLGMLAESFVTVVVAFPLFLVVILAIMVLVQTNPEFMLNILYVVIGLMIPLSQFMFIFAIWNMSQEA